MTALTALRKVITANRDPENVAEIRSYIEGQLVELADDLGVTPETITSELDTATDDSVLATKVLAAVKKAQASQRDLKKEGRARAAQAAADALASRATWDEDRVQLDLPAILSSVLTKRTDMIVFTTEDFTTSISMAPLFDLARLKLRDVTGFVDSKGLHLRWRDGRGGMNLHSKIDPHADRIVMCLSPKTKAEAA